MLSYGSHFHCKKGHEITGCTQGESLLGCQDSTDLQVISFHTDELQSNEIGASNLKGKTKEEIISQYAICLEGLGCIAEPYHIKMDESATPVIHPARKIPEALRERLKTEIDKMEKFGVISRVHEPTPWVKSIVINEKQRGKLSICTDPRDLNKAVKREHFHLPT